MPKKVKGDSKNPLIAGAALTSVPHLKQRGKPIKIVDDGKKVDLPLIRMGIYRHPVHGILNFDQEFFDSVISNHKIADSDYPAQLNHRHGEDYGTIAFMDHEDGGVMEQREKWLHCVAPIVDEESRQLIEKAEKGRWRFTSPEVYLDYKSNQVVKLSLDDLIELDEESTMADKKVIKVGDLEVVLLEEDGVTTLENASDIEEISKLFLSTSKKLSKSDDEIKSLKKDLEDVKDTLDQAKLDLEEAKKDTADPLDKLPDEAKQIIVQLQKEKDDLVRLRLEAEQEKLIQKVAFAISKARDYRDSNGMGHSPVVLSIAEKALMMTEYEDGDMVIKLEDSSDPVSIATYHRQLWVQLLEKAPGTMPVNAKGKEDDHKPNGVKLSWDEKDFDESVAEYQKLYG